MGNKEAREEIEIDIGDVFSVLLAKIWFIILAGITVGLIFLMFSKFVLTPVYSSSTKIYVLNRDTDNQTLTYTDLQVGYSLTKDYLELVKSRTVLVQVITELNLDMETDALANMITVETPSDTRIITITVEDSDAYLAQKIANKVREIASEHICSVMDLEAVNIVDEANIPTEPSSPNVLRNTFIGIVLGIFIAVAIVVIAYLVDDTVKTPDDVEKYLGVSVLASIPVLENDAKNNKKKKKKKKKVSA